MPANIDKTKRWAEDIDKSVQFYNKWFIEAAPFHFHKLYKQARKYVVQFMERSNSLKIMKTETEFIDLLRDRPELLRVVRLITAPPLAIDRLAGLCDVSRGFVQRMERSNDLPPKMSEEKILSNLESITSIIFKMIDYSLFPWLAQSREPTMHEIELATGILADRFRGILYDTLIRNIQEKQQLDALCKWLEERGYSPAENREHDLTKMNDHTYLIRPVAISSTEGTNVPLDLALMRPSSAGLLLVEAKSAGDFANVNKRRKEEAKKLDHLQKIYTVSFDYVLLLNGYFNRAYLQYMHESKIDWVWSHRLEDFKLLGV
ncbi:MAG: XamI family restriction endonuclease [Candidatus Thorarchaeota archaeon]|nr:XamI family restriction endonuclease [Candidatus Thorarchaeota archaeon]